MILIKLIYFKCTLQMWEMLTESAIVCQTRSLMSVTLHSFNDWS